MSTKTVDTVVVHPLVLLSVTDHYYRVAKDSKQKRVVGVLLGESFKGRLDIVNCFAVPFEEDLKDPSIFFLDHDYLETMFSMFKKIAAKERIVGFYSTGPKIRPADLLLDTIFRKYTSNPLLVIVDVRPDIEGIPIQAYNTVEEVKEGKEAVRTFVHVPAEIGAYEAEEVGVEHLLRDINDPSVSALGSDVRARVGGLRGLLQRLEQCQEYLQMVVEGKLPPNREILYTVQSILALLPNTNIDELRSALLESSNDQHLALYMGSLVRAITALHDLVNNKGSFREGETPEEAAEREKKEKESKEKEKKEKAEKAKEEEKRKKTQARLGGGGGGGGD